MRCFFCDHPLEEHYATGEENAEGLQACVCDDLSCGCEVWLDDGEVVESA